MKTNIKIRTIILLMILYACDFEHPTALVYPDISFKDNGLQFYNTNSIYNEIETFVTITRTYGLSKQIEITVQIDPTLLEEYNTLYKSDFILMGEQYYEIPRSIVFPANTQTVKLPVTLKPNNLTKELGLDKANKVLLPIKLTEADIKVEFVENSSSVLLSPRIASPIITVEMPTVTELAFLTNVPLTQDLTIYSHANFNTLDVNSVAFTVDASKVEVFNAENNANFVLCPKENYTIKEDLFDKETLRMISVITFDCSTLDPDQTYLLPLLLEQKATYEVQQEKVIYVVVSLTDLRVWPTVGDIPFKIGSGNGRIELNLNSPLTDNLPITLKYDIEKIEAYNTEHGTSYLALDATKVPKATGTIESGQKTGYASYSLDIKDLMYDDGKAYLIPYTIDESLLSLGAQTTECSTVYYQLLKTISGQYTKEERPVTKHKDNSVDYNYRFNTLVMLVDGSKVPFSKTDKKQKYAINYNTSWADGLLYFNLSDEEFEGVPGSMKIVDLQDRDEGWDPTNNFGSYFDTNTGDLIIHCNIEGYWNTYEIHVRLHDRTDQ